LSPDAEVEKFDSSSFNFSTISRADVPVIYVKLKIYSIVSIDVVQGCFTAEFVIMCVRPATQTVDDR
jgi:hypothetical protein